MTKFTDKSDNLDAAVAAIRADAPGEDAIASAAARVHAALAAGQQSSGTAEGDATPAAPAGERWDSIDDYIAAIPAYLAGTLSPAQATLFEEESRQSIPLRRALNAARQHNTGDSLDNSTLRKARRGVYYRWLAAAASVAAVALVVMQALPELPSLNQAQLARIDEIDGRLYQVIDGQLEPLVAGSWIDGRQRIRSASGSRAMLTLDDGSEIELDERSELSFMRRSSGNRIDVSRGRILVHASPQGSGTLDVYTDEFEVSVTGTIFEVAHGTKGSRVAVVEGSVNVNLAGRTTALEPGDAFGSRSEYLALSVADEIAWSKDADAYIALLQEFAALQQDIQEVIDSPTRYSTRLLDLAPANTAVYIAVPNAPEKVADIYELIRSRMQDSNTLSEIWGEFEDNVELAHVEAVMAWMREIGLALGDETVFILNQTGNGTGIEALPLVLSEVDAEAFAANFDAQVEIFRDALAAAGTDEDLPMSLIYSPAEAAAGQLNVLLYNDLLVATTDPALIAEMYTVLENGGSSFVDTALYAQLQATYNQGTEILGAVDFNVIIPVEDRPDLTEAGMHNLQHLIAQYQQQDKSSVVTADLFFDGDRSGAMSFLSTPAAMGSLEFFSAGTTVVAAALFEQPRTLLDSFGPIELDEDAAEFQAELDLFYQVIDVLGGELAFGLDGPALPTPSWKVVLEAYDSRLMQESIERTAARANQRLAEEGVTGSISITPADVEGYSGYQVTFAIDTSTLAPDADVPFDTITFNYAYVDGYLVAGPNTAILDRAIAYYQSGSNVQHSRDYRELMLRDGYLDVSAVYFSRLGRLMTEIMQNLPSTLTAEQEQAINELDASAGASMTSILALPNKVHVAHTGSLQWPLQLASQMAVLVPMLEDMAATVNSDENVSVDDVTVDAVDSVN